MRQFLLHAAGLTGVHPLARVITRRNLRILGYHGVWTTPGRPYGDRLFMAPAQFESRMHWLKDSGLPVIGLDAAIDGLADDSLPDHAVVITMDDGWRSTYTHMLPVLESLGLPATLYVSSWYVENPLPVINKVIDYALRMTERTRLDWQGLGLDLADTGAAGSALRRHLEALPVADRAGALRQLCEALAVPLEPWWSDGQFRLMTPAEIADAARRGLDIQLHTHRHPMLDRNIDRLEAEIGDNRAALAAALPDRAFRHFCYPSGGFHNDAPARLRALGVRSATLCDQGLNPPGSDPMRLRRFLDGRTVSQAMFEAYLSGALDLYEASRRRLSRQAI